MFDWFRKKKKTEPEAPAPEEQTIAAEAVEPEAEPAPEAEAPTPEPAPAQEAAGEALPPEPDDEPAEAAAAEAAPDLETPAPKKGFFARFRQKKAAPEEPATETAAEAVAAEPEAVEEPPELVPSASEVEAEERIAAEAEAEDAEVEALEEIAAEAEVEAGEPEVEALEETAAEAEAEAGEPEVEALEETAAEAEAEAGEPEVEALEETAVEAEAEAGEAEVEALEEIAVEAEIEAGEPEVEALEETAIEAEAEAGEAEVEALEEIAAEEEAIEDEAEDDEDAPRQGLFARFREKLSATRNRLAGRIETLLSSVRAIDDDLLDELEELLITADLGVQTTNDLLFKIRGQVAKKELSDAEALKEALKNRIRELVELPVPPRPEAHPMVIMVVGINGVGKTTTIAKLARRLKEDEGQKVLLAAGDTFRSAAVEQLGIWAERLGVDIVSQPTGADASAVVFDALTAAQARQTDVVIIDTAGRLHTKVNLMDELKKIKRVAGKAMPGAPHHTILVLDGNTGQNAMRQAQTFHEAVGVDSIIITKLDGTAKGGVIVSITNELKIPIAFVGLGESFDDLQPFDAQAFTEAILGC